MVVLSLEKQSESPEELRRRLLREIEDLREQIKKLRELKERVIGGVSS
ncbi:MAG: hypothetical protein QXZ14_11975 [Candidatus Jordarchaeales archaeon]